VFPHKSLVCPERPFGEQDSFFSRRRIPAFCGDVLGEKPVPLYRWRNIDRNLPERIGTGAAN
jgi:hypothetical protein